MFRDRILKARTFTGRRRHGRGGSMGTSMGLMRSGRADMGAIWNVRCERRGCWDEEGKYREMNSWE